MSDDVIPIESRRNLRPVAGGIRIGPDLGRVVDEAIAALARAPEIYQRAGELVEVITDDPVTRGLTRTGPIARIQRCVDDRIVELLARTEWYSPDGAGGQRQVRPPRSVARMVMARGRWEGIRPIAMVATAPTMRPDGSILSAPGYDAATSIYMAPSVDVDVPDQPTLEDAQRAVALLLDVITDFPVAGKATRSAWVAGLLAVVARPAIDGPIPMIIVDASIRGAGKSLLVDVASIVATGRTAARMIYSRDDAEIRKVITAVLMAGDPIVALDNVVGELGCPRACGTCGATRAAAAGNAGPAARSQPACIPGAGMARLAGWHAQSDRR